MSDGACGTRICILHGYLLEGSGSNLWTRAILDALCRQGHTVHLMAQENHPESYPFIAEARRYLRDGDVVVWHRKDVSCAGGCILHKPELGETLPVYVWDRYDEFPRVVPMVELTDEELESYVQRNTEVLLRIVREQGITALHANHSVLMSVVAQRVSERTGIPYAIMPHGSALEYAVKKEQRYLRLAESAFAGASRIFIIGDELRGRVQDALPDVPDLDAKFVELHLGVDTSQFEPAARAERPARIARLAASLAPLPRGRTMTQTAALRAHLDVDPGELSVAMAAARGYDGKRPDANLEAELEGVDWERDRTLLFVGRLISTKGPQSVIMALPELLAQEPRLRLVVVGHGPLREPLEALLWAMECGETALLERIVAQGRALEGSPEGEGAGTSLTQCVAYLDQLRAEGRYEQWLALAREHVRPDRVLFTGYLTHRELRWLFPCCDAAIFPSVVREAGPLVFLEAMASGAFPLGTYFGGMAASIDTVAEVVPPEVAGIMKLSAQSERTVADIVGQVPRALALGEQWQPALFQLARERYDWSSVARTLNRELEAL